jgi:hypothetical protein
MTTTTTHEPNAFVSLLICGFWIAFLVILFHTPWSVIVTALIWIGAACLFAVICIPIWTLFRDLLRRDAHAPIEIEEPVR